MDCAPAWVTIPVCYISSNAEDINNFVFFWRGMGNYNSDIVYTVRTSVFPYSICVWYHYDPFYFLAQYVFCQYAWFMLISNGVSFINFYAHELVKTSCVAPPADDTKEFYMLRVSYNV